MERQIDVDTDPRAQEFLAAHPDVAGHLRWCRAQSFSENTTGARYLILARLALSVELETATTDELAAWLAAGQWTPKTRHVYHNHLKGFYGWRKATGLADTDPMAALPPPKVPEQPPRRPPSEEVVQHLLATVPEPWRTAILLARYQGFRCMEIAAARREHVTASTFTVRGKGGKVAELPTHTRVWEHIRDRGPGPLVLYDGEPMTSLEVSNRWRSYALMHWLPVRSMHLFRHLYCNRLRKAGVDVRVIQTLMRHNSLETTMRYMHVDEDERRAAMALI